MHRISISVDDIDYRRFNNCVKDTILYTLKHVNLRRNDAEVSVLFADSNNIQELNKIYRNTDKPTNVLSFANNNKSSVNGKIPMCLGDIVLAIDIIKTEAENQGKTFINHLIHLTVHGTLHLIGYDHIHDEEACEMEKLEIDILHNLGIKDPYII